MSVSGAGKSGGSSHSSSRSSSGGVRSGTTTGKTMGGASSSRSTGNWKGAPNASRSTSKTTSKTTSKATGKTTSKTTGKTTKKATGANPKLAAAVKSINISQYRAKNKTTYCNWAVNAYAKKLGYKGFQGLNANQMFSKMSKPGSGWRKATAAEAIAAAKQGKLTVAGWTGKVHGHVSAVIGEYAKGVPAIAQAGGHVDKKTGKTVDNTFEYGSITRTRKDPSYFVHD